MHFELPASELYKALKKIGGAIETRNTIPILSNVMITALKGENAITIRGTDLDIEATIMVQADVKRDGKITANAAILQQYTQKLGKDGLMSVEANADETKVICKQGRSRVELPTLSTIDFPRLSVGDLPYEFSMQAADLASMFTDVRFAISTEETRYYLNGVYLHIAKNNIGEESLCFVATDGHRLSLSCRQVEGLSSSIPGIIVPRKTVHYAISLCEGADIAKVATSDSKIRFEIGNIVLVSKLIDGSFPDYERVIPRGNNQVATFAREELVKVVDRVTVVSREKGSGTRFEFGDNKLVVSVRGADIGSGEEEMEISYDAPPIAIGFNSRYMADVLDSFEGAALDIVLSDASSPALFREQGNPNRLAVAMPMRV